MKHHFQFSPGSYDLMTGCPLEWKCFVPCLLIDWSQHPTWPQLKHRRRCTHVDPICKHSSQPLGVLGMTFLTTWSRWTQDGPLSFWFMCMFMNVHSFMLSVKSNSTSHWPYAALITPLQVDINFYGHSVTSASSIPWYITGVREGTWIYGPISSSVSGLCLRIRQDLYGRGDPSSESNSIVWERV